MIKASDLRNKEIINLSTNEKIGYVSDLEINKKSGIIEALLVPDKNKSFIMSKKKRNTYSVVKH